MGRKRSARKAEAEAKLVNLEWRFKQVYVTLMGLLRGDAMPDELARALSELGLPDEPTRKSEPKIFAGLLRAKTSRRVRTLVRQSEWLRKSDGLGAFLWLYPERFINLRDSARLARSGREFTLERQVEILSRRLAGVLAGYKPATAERYLAGYDRCEHCGIRPACWAGLMRGGIQSRWCGYC